MEAHAGKHMRVGYGRRVVLVVVATIGMATCALVGLLLARMRGPQTAVVIRDVDGCLEVSLSTPNRVLVDKRGGTAEVIWPGRTTARLRQIDGETYRGIAASGAGEYLEVVVAVSGPAQEYRILVDSTLALELRLERVDAGVARLLWRRTVNRGHHRLVVPCRRAGPREQVQNVDGPRNDSGEGAGRANPGSDGR
jgi:hypothetical protein